MSKSKQLFEETRVLIEVDEDTLRYFIRQWHEFSSRDESPQELAESVQQNFAIKCTIDNVISAFGLDIEEDDITFQMKNLNMYQ